MAAQMTTVVDDLIKKFQKMDAEIQQMFVNKTTTLAQFNENTLVKGELDMLEGEDPAVYKLVGPVLMTVSLEDAKENVGKRVEFIEDEIKKIDKQIADKQGEQATLGTEIQTLQAVMQKDASDAARQAAEEATQNQ